MDQCDECGFTYEDRGARQLADDLRGLGPRFAERLKDATGSEGDALVRRRPKPQVWSVLEYACHIRDVLLAQRERLFLALVEDCPSFAPIYRKQRVTLARYQTQECSAVADQIEVAATLVSDAFGGVDHAGWQRDCIYNFPVPARRSVAWLRAHPLHEGEHHLADVDRVLAAMR